MMSDYTFSGTAAFHGSTDLVSVAELWPWNGEEETEVGERHIVTETRTLRYRFYPHFHRYVGELAHRLIEGSVAGLQDADTDYVRNSDGTFETLPDSFHVALPNGLVLDLPKPGKPTESERITLRGSINVLVPDGTNITLSNGSVESLPGRVIAREKQRGVRVGYNNGPHVDLDIGAEVSLADSPQIMLPEGIVVIGENGKERRLTEASPVTVPAGTEVKLVGGKPRPKLFQEIFTPSRYAPTNLVQRPYPVRDLDFSPSGAYSVNNWELFYHIPLTIGIHLSKSQRYEEAQRWFHHIFDPTDDSEGPTPNRFWKVKPFQFTEAKKIEEILVNLSSGADPVLKQETINSIAAWKDNPFRPHLVARYRHTAFKYKAVMAYLDNLIAWGDDLFRQDTIETINEATQIYVLAAMILGEKPQVVPKKGSIAPVTYASRRSDWDEFGNTLERLESEIPFDFAPFPAGGNVDDKFAVVRNIGMSLYFCVPRNDKLMGYWSTVADRLWKIHNSLNLQGVFRQLPLFEPPIDPALLARAAAAGLDVGAIVAGINQPLPLVRFQSLIQKATEICQEVKSLGNSLLSVIEKEDNEALAILRARHEKVVLGLVETVKYAQWQEAKKSREALEVSFANAKARYIYFERMLGVQKGDIKLQEMDAIQPEGLVKRKFKANEPDLQRRPVDVDIAQDLDDSGGYLVNRHEAKELSLMGTARDIQDAVRITRLAAQGLGLIPDFGANLHFWGMGGHMDISGGTKLSHVATFAADVANTIADRMNYEAGRAAKIGAHARRQQDWAFQSATLTGELNQIFKQLRAAEIREFIAEQEWRNHQQQMKHAQEIEDFLTQEKDGKTTNQAFYVWMKREVRGMYGQVFQFAFDVAKKAERALQHELGRPDLTFLQFGYMSGKEGLLAGEKLYFDLKRMEMAYHDLNQREYELTKNVSLMQVDPLALLDLRTTGSCTVSLPESLFDLDGPGHYFRRIKSVAVSVPCVTGPYASVNCSLTLTKSSIRKDPALSDSYKRTGPEDSRFNDYFGNVQTIVTSTAQADSGMFEANLRDERYLPFENMGVIGEWRLELPANPELGEPRQFDYDTISDVILHIRYTSREGGQALRGPAKKNLQTAIDQAEAAGSTRLFSIRHEFPSEWAKFTAPHEEGAPVPKLELEIRPEHFPYWSNGNLTSILDMTQVTQKDRAIKHGQPNGRADLFNRIADGSEVKLEIPDLSKIADNGFGKSFRLKLSLDVDDTELDNLWLALKWGKKSDTT